MMIAWRAELRKNLLVFVSDRSQPVLLLLLPILVVFFASYAIQGLVVSSSRYRLPVVDLDHTSQSATIADALRNDGQFTVEPKSADDFSAEDAATLLGGGKRIAVFVIPRGTSDSVATGRAVSFPLYVDPTQDTRYGLMFLAIERALYRLSAPGAAVRIVAQAAGVPESQVFENVNAAVSSLLAHPAVEVNEQPTTRGRSLPNAYDQTVPGIALMWAIGAILYATVTAFEERKIHHTWQRTLASPASRSGVLIGKLTSTYLYVAITVVTLFIVGRVVFDMDLGNLPLLLLTLAAFLTVPAALAVLLAVSGMNQQVAGMLSSVGMFAIGALSGALVPLYVLPGWLEKVAVVSPLYWGKSAAQDIMIRGASFRDVSTALTALLALGFVISFVSLVRFRSLRT